MSWTGFMIENVYYDLTHLRTSTHNLLVDGNSIIIHINYSCHCFTDEKGNGVLLTFNNEQRCWSQERYERSKELPELIKSSLLSHYAVPYLARKLESYYHVGVYDYAIFFRLSKPNNTTNELKLRVISAYEIDKWGKDSLPKGKYKKISWILSQRLQSKFVLR